MVSSVYGCLQCSIDLRWPVESEEWVSDCGDAVGSIPLSLCFTFCRWNFTSLWMTSSSGRCCSFNWGDAVCIRRGSSRAVDRRYLLRRFEQFKLFEFVVAVANLDVGIRPEALHSFSLPKTLQLYEYEYEYNIVSYRIVSLMNENWASEWILRCLKKMERTFHTEQLLCNV